MKNEVGLSTSHSELLKNYSLNILCKGRGKDLYIFPKVKDKIITYCNEHVSEGTLSTEIIRSRIKLLS